MHADNRELLALGMFGRGSRLGDRIEMLLARGREFSPRVSRARMAVSSIALLGSLIAGALAPRMVALAEESRFEVTSVKANHSSERGWTYRRTASGYAATNVSVHNLIVDSYRVFDFQVENAPGWVNTDRFDVEGKTGGKPGGEQIRSMVRSLLADRFQLAIQRETKRLAVYELTVAKGGIKFNEGRCVGVPGPQNPCGGGTGGRGVFMAREAGVGELTHFLAPLLGRVVVDKTGLKGKYDFDLHWTPDESALKGPGDPDEPAPDPNGPSIFAAVQEQLGLELRPAKGPVEMLVIEHAERPDAN
jgi:uncharacterized protein (TIGR03435 family)